jgi:hypothetical protein
MDVTQGKLREIERWQRLFSGIRPVTRMNVIPGRVSKHRLSTPDENYIAWPE